MTTLIWTYIGLYVLLGVLMQVVDATMVPAEERDPRWENIADTVLLVLGLAGMLLYQGAVEVPALQSAWRVVVPVLVVGHGLLILKTAWQFFGPDGTYRDESPSAVWGGAAGAAFVIVPSLWLNYLYAYR